MVALQHGAPLGDRRLDGTARRAARPAGRGHRVDHGAARDSIGSGRRAPTTIGLETMPRTVDNIGFYSRLAPRPGPPDRDARARRAAPDRRRPHELLSARGPSGRGADRGMPPAYRRAASRRGLHARDHADTRSPSRGHHAGARETGELAAFALWHSVPLAAGQAQGRAARAQAGGAIRSRRSTVCSMPCRPAPPPSGWIASPSGARASSPPRTCGWSDSGYRVHWTDLRMLLEGFPAAGAAGRNRHVELGDLSRRFQWSPRAK